MHLAPSNSPPVPRPLQATAIVGVLPQLKLEVYALKRQDKGFATLLGTVKDILFKHDSMQASC